MPHTSGALVVPAEGGGFSNGMMKMDADNKKKPGWTEERVEKLKELWAEGLSASEIARVLGGVTRNAVIGKVHRLRLAGRAPARRGKPASGSPAKRREPRKKTATQRPATPVTNGATALKAQKETAPVEAVKAEVAPLSLVESPCEGRITNIMDLTHKTCRWPIGDPTDENFAYCGDNAQPGSPYCEHHARIAYQSATDRRRRASG